MATPHLDTARALISAALGDRLAPGVDEFLDLFTDDAVLEIPFDRGGTAPPFVGRAAIAGLARALDGVLALEDMELDRALPCADPDTVVFEYHGVLVEVPEQRRHRRHYVAIATVRDGRVAHLREYGGPRLPFPDDGAA